MPPLACSLAQMRSVSYKGTVIYQLSHFNFNLLAYKIKKNIINKIFIFLCLLDWDHFAEYVIQCRTKEKYLNYLIHHWGYPGWRGGFGESLQSMSQGISKKNIGQFFQCDPNRIIPFWFIIHLLSTCQKRRQFWSS